MKSGINQSRLNKLISVMDYYRSMIIRESLGLKRAEQQLVLEKG